MPINRRDFLKYVSAGVVAASLPVRAETATSNKALPNVVFILTDDLGYNDLGCYGATDIKTPNLDRLAREGLRGTDFHTPAGVCTPTRAALMTGCYPKRVGLHVGVLGEKGDKGLNPDEFTLAEMFHNLGYATACVGKWHLGTNPEFLPTRQGFDSYFGMPGPNHGASDLYRNEAMSTAKKDVNKDQLTQDYTKEAVQFIQQAKGRPFFLYLAHGAPHTPLYASVAFKGKSAAGLYGDMIEEVDWSCGEVFKALQEAGVAENTLVVFASDNGPANRAAPPWHGAKGSTWEGGFRVPCIVRWPGHVPAGRVVNEFFTMMDFLPTFAAITGGQLPAGRKIDGYDVGPLLTGAAGARSPYPAFYYYGRDGKLCAVRQGPWKLHTLEPSEKWFGKLPDQTGLLDTRPATPPPWLYNLETDPGETRNVAGEHPDLVTQLQTRMQEFDRQLEAEARPAGKSATRSQPATSPNEVKPSGIPPGL